MGHCPIKHLCKPWLYTVFFVTSEVGPFLQSCGIPYCNSLTKQTTIAQSNRSLTHRSNLTDQPQNTRSEGMLGHPWAHAWVAVEDLVLPRCCAALLPCTSFTSSSEDVSVSSGMSESSLRAPSSCRKGVRRRRFLRSVSHLEQFHVGAVPCGASLIYESNKLVSAVPRGH